MGTQRDLGVSPEIPLGVCPSFLSISNGECAWIFYQYTACTLLLLYLQDVGIVPKAVQLVNRNRTGAGQKQKLPAAGGSPTAPSHHPRPVVLLLLLSYVASRASPAGACAPKLPLLAGILKP